VEEKTCSKCSATGDKIVVTKCPICHKQVCDACNVNRSGRIFCSAFCADHFFFDEEE